MNDITQNVKNRAAILGIKLTEKVIKNNCELVWEDAHKTNKVLEWRDDIVYSSLTGIGYSTLAEISKSVEGDIAPLLEFENSEKYMLLDSILVRKTNVVEAVDTGRLIFKRSAFKTIDGKYVEKMGINLDKSKEISNYHSSNRPLDFKKILKSKTRMKIGFEIEKNNFKIGRERLYNANDKMPYYRIFKGYETDSSCGVEAITNLLPLASRQSHSAKVVYKMIHEAKDIINSPYDQKCGGHINVSVDGLPAEDLYEMIRIYMPILYAIYPKRLLNKYCKNDLRLEYGLDSSEHYKIINVKRNYIEIRLFPAVKNTYSLVNRYDLMYIIMYYGVMHKLPLQEVFNKAKPVIKKMFKNSTSSIEKIESLIEPFEKFIMDDIVNKDIVDYIYY